MNLKPFPLTLIFLAASVLAHGDHSQGHTSGDAEEYARRHVRVLAPNSCGLGFKFVCHPTRWQQNIICTQGYRNALVWTLTCRGRDTFDLPSFFQLHDLNRRVHN